MDIMMINTLTIFGTRPEAIKMAPVIEQLNQHNKINNQVCVTGQHQHMLESVLELFEIKADYNLQVMTQNQDLSSLTAKIITSLDSVFKQFKPQIVLVHGDTTTTLAASLAAYYHRIPIGHVEAGLRTGNIFLPWPEEANRKLTGSLASIHFAPTDLARDNLLKEGMSPDTIHVTGNTVIDALHMMTNRLATYPGLKSYLNDIFPFVKPDRKFILITGHRRENFGSGFDRICMAIAQIAKLFPDVDLVYPVHLNPNVQKPVRTLLADIPNIHLIEPVDYLPFVYLMQSCYLILTDSGGIQEEAPALGKPVLVMRESTERPEAVIAGTVKLVGSDVNTIVEAVENLLLDEALYQKMSASKNPYGDGTAASQIAEHIANMSFETQEPPKKVLEVC
jgi:UDP-N-acetylglucosamine 2-epimerase (non-hydrolysing)